MGIKETPTNFRTYYKTMRDSVRPKYEKAVEDYEKLYVEEKALYEDIKSKAQVYKANYKFNVNDYPEFINNEYSTGTFYDAAKGLFMNKKNNYAATNPLYKLYKLSRQQKDLSVLHAEKLKYEKMLDLSLDEYSKVLESFYNEVHKKMILEGKGYVFEGNIGWLCINRCHVRTGKRTVLDYKATKENKARLLAEGKRLWNKEEAEYYQRLGREYDGVDYRVYRNNEYCYEIVLLGCRLGVGDKLRFEAAARRRYTVGNTDEKMIAQCNRDKNKICELPLDIRRKLYLCLQVDDLLYLNFIRNEAQQSAHTPKANRKN